ncbi:MAG: DUF4184 family protein [Rubrivivax sp.]|nr:DUF4184 family protein [Rubrivivax sp.]
MPWTFSHPAAVLPLARCSRHLPFVGLVVGSMAPDFGYYVGAFALAHEAHRPFGLLWLCLPPGLLIVWLLRAWHARFIALVPQPHRAALATLQPPAALGMRGWLGMAAAIVVGAATHMLWDACTHSHGFAVRAWSLLQQPVMEFGGRRLFVYNTLQHASTVIGLLCLAWAYRRWLRSRQPAAVPDDGLEPLRRRLWLGALALAFAVALPWSWFGTEAADGPYRFSIILVSALIRATALYALLLLAAAACWPRAARMARAA